MKIRIACVLIAVARLGFAQQPKYDQAVAETRKLMQAFRGAWSISETYEPSDSMPQGGSGKGEEIWRSGPGERSVIEEYRSTLGNGKTLTGFGLGWWEAESGGFRLNWCDSEDPRGCTRLDPVAKWDGNRWVVRDRIRVNGMDTEFEEVFSDITPNSFTQTLSQGPPGKFKRFLTIKAVRKE
jgi:hypothetical protein